MYADTLNTAVVQTNKDERSWGKTVYQGGPVSEGVSEQTWFVWLTRGFSYTRVYKRNTKLLVFTFVSLCWRTKQSQGATSAESI